MRQLEGVVVPSFTRAARHPRWCVPRRGIPFPLLTVCRCAVVRGRFRDADRAATGLGLWVEPQ